MRLGPIRLTRGTCLGAWIRTDQHGTVEQYEAGLGARLHNVAFFARWGAPIGLASLRPLPSGAMPLPNVNLPYGGSQRDMDTLLRELDAFAAPVVIRYAGEFDRPRGGTTIVPGRFIDDWNRVRGYVRERYPLAAFAWAPTAMGLQPYSMRAVPYWPGADQVDVPAADGYDTTGKPRSFVEVIGPACAWYAEHAPTKRVAVLETGVTTVDRTDAYRAQWLRDMAASVALGGPLGSVAVVTYFDSKPPSEAGVDWLLEAGTEAWRAWQALLQSPAMHSHPWRIQPSA